MKKVAVLLYLVASVACAQERVSLVLSDVRLVELLRIAYGELSKEPFVLSHEVLDSQERFTVDLRQVSTARVVAAVADLAKSAGFEVKRRAGVVLVGKPADIDDEVLIYHPRHRSARYLADVVQSVTAAKSVLARQFKPVEQQGQGLPAAGSSPPLKHSSPTSVEGMIDRSEVDQIAFTVSAKDAGKVNKLLRDLDTPSGELFLKAAVYEVGTTRAEGSAVRLAIELAGVSGSLAGNILNGASIAFKQGGIEAILSALDADVRFRSLSRPQVRIKNGAQARFSVGQEVPVLGGAQLDRSGNPVQSVEYKSSGVILTATPEIRGDVIELNLNQELSNFVVTKSGVNGSPTLIKRAVSTRLGLMPGEVVMLAGLQEEQDDESENHLPLVGWVLGQEKQKRRSEILVFIEVMRI